MPLEPLATPPDLAARLGVTFTDAQTARAAALIDDASAVVRNYTRQDITAGSDTAILEPTDEQWLYLPQRPVTAVTAVTAAGAMLVPGLWRLQNDALYRYDGWNSRRYQVGGAWNQPDTITVDYSHGYTETPGDIVRVVCKLTEISWANPQGFRSYAMDDLQVAFATQTVGIGGLDPEDMRILDFYRRARRSVTLSAGIL